MIRREPCAKCSMPVFIAERLNVGKLLYHRTCFRCARCNSQLTLANYYETEESQFCCETCPDEEKPPSAAAAADVLQRSLSDEEKSATLEKNTPIPTTDTYSSQFETALEYPEGDDTLKKSGTLQSEYTRARSFFMSSQVGAGSDSGNEENGDFSKQKRDFNEENRVKIDENGCVGDSGFPKSDTFLCGSFKEDSFSSAGSVLDDARNVTKDVGGEESDGVSLVKARMRLFESDQSDSVSKSVAAEESVTPVIVDAKHSLIDDDVPNKTIEDENLQVSPEKNRSSEDPVEGISEESEVSDEEPKQEQGLEDATEVSIIVISDEEEEVSIRKSPETGNKPLESYPDDLNPFGDEDSKLNPFEDEYEEVTRTPNPKPRKKVKPLTGDGIDSPLYVKRISINTRNEEMKKTPSPKPRRKIKPLSGDAIDSPLYIERISINPGAESSIQRKASSLNPFEDEECEDEDVTNKDGKETGSCPVPRTRIFK